MSDDPIQMPADVREPATLRAIFHVPPSVHASVVEELSGAGRLYGLPGSRFALCSEADYLAALGRFMQRVPGVKNAIAANAQQAKQQAQQQAVIDREQRRAMRRAKCNALQMPRHLQED